MRICKFKLNNKINNNNNKIIVILVKYILIIRINKSINKLYK